MPVSLFSTRVRQFGAALVLSAVAIPALAVPIMDMHLEDLLPMAPDFKKELNLNANQQTLWQQTESRSRQVLRERQSRRLKMQDAVATALAGKQVELRDVVGVVDAETAATAAEEKQMREWWLTVNDALNEQQRQQVATFLSEQMMRVADGGFRPAARDKDDAPAKTGGHRHGAGGSAGGNGGNVTIPGM